MAEFLKRPTFTLAEGIHKNIIDPKMNQIPMLNISAPPSSKKPSYRY
jgi:hypothetical protein